MSEANNERVYGPQYKLIGKNYATADLLAKDPDIRAVDVIAVK